MAVPRAFMATLAGTFQPLMGAEQSACGVPPMPSHCPSAAVLDVSENMRAKIYALCCKMSECVTSTGACCDALLVCRVPVPLRRPLN